MSLSRSLERCYRRLDEALDDRNPDIFAAACRERVRLLRAIHDELRTVAPTDPGDV
jgi:hypothetical protein